MKIGVVSRSVPPRSHLEIATHLREAGAVSTELCLHSSDTHYWVYNGRSDMSDLSDERFLSIVQTYRDHGIEVPALGVFTNLIAREESERQANLAYYENHMRLAHLAGIPFVPTECGFFPGERGVNTDRYEAEFDRLKDSLSWLCKKAEQYDVCIALEASLVDIVPSAKRARDLIEQVGSDRLKVLLDPANLIANSSEEDMFRYLAPHIAYLHGKDRKVNDVWGRAVGDGDIDWRLFFQLYHKYAEGKPFILEYVNEDNFREIMRRVNEYDA